MATSDAVVTLRPAAPEQAGAIGEIWHLGWRDGHLGHVPDALAAVRTPGSFAERAARRIGDTVVALVGDGTESRVAGFVMVVGDEVEQVYVDAAHRGSGVAAALLAEAEERVRRGGYERAWLAVVAGNGRARRFYERSGWRDEGRFDYPATGPAGPIPVPAHRYTKQVGGGPVSGSGATGGR